jgi:selenocysteine-specific elongation factor
MIVGTAGHIDHGKTSLVRALTGVDTDRLKQEKERGISIELGYAYTPLPNGDVLGFVDVPGHERLIHTMVAGACGIDFALLVVAADDGVMPQTREHLAILLLLGVTRGAVAITKVDRTSPERVREVESEVRTLLQPRALKDAPIFQVNSTAGNDPGVTRLRKYLVEAGTTMRARGDDGLFRLAIDRVFTLPGYGTIVAGCVFSGSVHVGDNLIVMPGGFPARVRSIHTENRPSERGVAGQRCALNLAGIEKSTISRGDWLGDQRVLIATKRIDARVHWLAHNQLKFSPGASVHVHIGAAHALARLILIDPEHPSPGESTRAQFVFDTAICALPGDRFIVRDAQAAHTIGGGVVLDALAPSRKRRSEQRLQYLDALEKMISGHGLSQLLADAPNGVALADLERLTGHKAASVILPVGTIVRGTSQDQFAILETAWEKLREDALRALRNYHLESPDDPGPDCGRLRRIARPDVPTPLWTALVDELTRDGSITRHGPWLQLPEHAVSLSESDQELARQLQSLIAQGHPEPPWVRDLASAVRQPEERVRQILRRQVASGTLCQIVHDLFYDSERVETLAGVVASLAREQGGVDAASYRDAIGLGRKRSVQILEFFDRAGYTRRVHDVHVLRKDSGWHVAHGP